MSLVTYLVLAALAGAALVGAVVLSALGNTDADTSWKAFLALVAYLVGVHTPAPPGVNGGGR